MYDFKDTLYILFLDFIKLMIIIFLGYISFKIILFNNSLGKNIADLLNIPYDQTLTVMSIGFVNQFTLILSLFELIFVVKVLSYLSKFRVLKRIYIYFYNFIGW